MFIPKSFREENSDAWRSRALVWPQASLSWAGRVMKRAWGREAMSRRRLGRACLVSGCARDICGRFWDHASKGEGDRCLMAFHGGRCPGAEMCIQARGAAVRLVTSQPAGGPRGQEGRGSEGQTQSLRWWEDVLPAQMGCSSPCSLADAPLFSVLIRAARDTLRASPFQELAGHLRDVMCLIPATSLLEGYYLRFLDNR